MVSTQAANPTSKMHIAANMMSMILVLTSADPSGFFIISYRHGIIIKPDNTVMAATKKAQCRPRKGSREKATTPRMIASRPLKKWYV